MKKQSLLKSLIVSGVTMVAILALLLFTTEFSWVTIVFPLMFFTMVSQLFWGGFIVDSFEFFCHSFTAPFIFVFEFDLDGILWLITVKLACWIFCAILSVAFFLLGVIFNLFASVFTFPFALVRFLKEQP